MIRQTYVNRESSPGALQNMIDNIMTERHPSVVEIKSRRPPQTVDDGRRIFLPLCNVGSML